MRARAFFVHVPTCAGNIRSVIQRLTVRNFRCLEVFDLDLTDLASALLVGKNGAGKSTVGCVFQLLQQIGRGINKIGSLVKVRDFSHGRTNAPMTFELHTVLEGKTFRYLLELELPENFKELRVRHETLSADGEVLFWRENAQVGMTRADKAADVAFLLDWHLIALPVLQEKSFEDPIFVFKNWLSRMIVISPIPSLIEGDSEGETLTPDLNLINFSEWFSGLIAHSPSAYTTIDKYLREVFLDFKDIKNPVIGAETRSMIVSFQHGQRFLNVPFKELSDGEKCFFVCAVTLASNEAYGPIFCFWDEPDNYLSVSEVGHFITSLRRSFETGGQFLATSHNSEAIKRFSNENTILLNRKNHFDSTVSRRLSEMNIEGDVEQAFIRGEVEF